MKSGWWLKALVLPVDDELSYVTVVRKDGTRGVIKARYLADEKAHKRAEGKVPGRKRRWNGPGWYADGSQLGPGCYEIRALYPVPDRVVAYMDIPDVPEPYDGEL